MRPILSKLFKKSLTLLMTSGSVLQAKEHLRRIFIICLSETEGVTITSEKTPCEIEKGELKKLLLGIPYPEDDGNDDLFKT